jgi:hypothetical protein
VANTIPATPSSVFNVVCMITSEFLSRCNTRLI